MTIGARLRKLRQEKGLSIEAAARQLDISYSLLAMYERDERTPPTDKLVMLASFYETTVAYLVGEVPVRDPKVLREVALHHVDRRNDPSAPISETLRERIRRLQDELGQLADELDDPD